MAREGTTYFTSVGIARLLVQGTPSSDSTGGAGQVLVSGGASGTISWETLSSSSLSVASSSTSGIVNTGTQTFAGAKSFLNQVTVSLGSVGSPSYSFIGDTDTGIFSSGPNILNLVRAGQTALQIGLSGGANYITAPARMDVDLAFGAGLSGAALASILAVVQAGNGNSILTGTRQWGVYSAHTASSAAIGAAGNPTVAGFVSGITTANSAFIAPIRAGFYHFNITKGAASTITRDVAFMGVMPTQGTNNCFISDNETFVGNYFLHSTSANPSALSAGLTLGATTHSSAVLLRLTSGASGITSGATQYGALIDSFFSSSATTEGRVISAGVATPNTAFVLPIAYSYFAALANKGAANTITRLVNYGGVNQTAGGSNAFIADNTAFNGDYFINSASTNRSLLSGALGIGGIFGTNDAQLYVGGTNLSSAGNQFGIYVSHTFNSSATSVATGIRSEVATANSSFTCGLARAFSANAASKGAASTITRLVNYYSTTQTAGTNNADIADNTSFTGNWFINSTSTNPSLFSGIVQMAAGVRTIVSTANTANPPTLAELNSAFGTAATVGSGFIGILNDNNGGTNEYMCWSDGTNWFYTTGTKAV